MSASTYKVKDRVILIDVCNLEMVLPEHKVPLGTEGTVIDELDSSSGEQRLVVQWDWPCPPFIHRNPHLKGV